MSRRYPRFLSNLLLVVPLIFLLYAPAVAGKAYAQSEGDVSLTARPGFDGYCKEENWLPVHVEVQNTGPDLDGTVRVSYKNDQGGRTATSLEVPLPTNSRKEFFLYIYPQGPARNMSVELMAKGRTLKKIDLAVTCLSTNNTLFGVLADTPSTFDVLNDVQAANGFVRVAQLTLSDLPASPQAWESLDALIVSNVDTGRLTPEQKQALALWLGAGGKLLVFGGPNWQETAAGLKEFLPIDIDTTLRVSDLSQLQAYIKGPELPRTETVLATGTLDQGADVPVEQDGIPVLVRKQTGAGTVHYFAADPSLHPLSGWPGMQDLYTHLLGFRAAPPTWQKGQSTTYYAASQGLATIPELGMPSILYICGLLVFYILVIGPLNYFVLRRIKKRELAWATIPALVVVFTGLSYSTGLLYRGTTPILNRLTIMQAWEGVEQARVRALVGIYSPIRAKYNLEAAGSFLIRPTGGGDINLQAYNDWTAVLQNPGMVMPNVSIEIGGMKAAGFEGNLPALAFTHNLVLSLDKTQPNLSGSITNKSAYTLENAFLVTPGQWRQLGDLAPGQTKQVNLSLLHTSNGPDFYSLSAMAVLGVNYSDLETDANVARRHALLQTVLAQEYRANRANWGIYLMGWIDESLLPVGLQDQKFKTIDTTLYIDMLSPSVKTGRETLTLPASIFAWESSEANVSPYYVSGVPSGSYTLHFRPAVPIHFREVTSLHLFLSSNALPGEIVASAWNYEEKQWNRMPIMGDRAILPDANDYVGPDNEVRIRIMTNRSDWTEITASYITMVVEP